MMNSHPRFDVAAIASVGEDDFEVEFSSD